MYKNGALLGYSVSSLLYDQDLGFLKVVSGGSILSTFNPSQITGAQASVTGALIKKYHVAVWFKFPSGDEFAMDFVAPNQETSINVRNHMMGLAHIGQANMEVKKLLKVKERVPMTEVGTILARHGLPGSPTESAKFVENLIGSGAADGVVDGDNYVSRSAKQRETVNYQVVTSFDVTKDGVISLKCPSCGSPVQMLDPSPNRKCEYCGAGFMVPKRILDIL
jgi:hypothetical protein